MSDNGGTVTLSYASAATPAMHVLTVDARGRVTSPSTITIGNYAGGQLTIPLRGGDAILQGGEGKQDAFLTAGHGAPDGRAIVGGSEVLLRSSGQARVRLDAGGTLRYRGSEVATVSDVNMLHVEMDALWHAFGFAMVCAFFAALFGTQLSFWIRDARRTARVAKWLNKQPKGSGDPYRSHTHFMGPG